MGTRNLEVSSITLLKFKHSTRVSFILVYRNSQYKRFRKVPEGFSVYYSSKPSVTNFCLQHTYWSSCLGYKKTNNLTLYSDVYVCPGWKKLTRGIIGFKLEKNYKWIIRVGPFNGELCPVIILYNFNTIYLFKSSLEFIDTFNTLISDHQKNGNGHWVSKKVKYHSYRLTFTKILNYQQPLSMSL